MNGCILRQEQLEHINRQHTWRALRRLLWSTPLRGFVGIMALFLPYPPCLVPSSKKGLEWEQRSNEVQKVDARIFSLPFLWSDLKNVSVIMTFEKTNFVLRIIAETLGFVSHSRLCTFTHKNNNNRCEMSNDKSWLHRQKEAINVVFGEQGTTNKK